MLTAQRSFTIWAVTLITLVRNTLGRGLLTLPTDTILRFPQLPRVALARLASCLRFALRQGYLQTLTHAHSTAMTIAFRVPVSALMPRTRQLLWCLTWMLGRNLTVWTSRGRQTSRYPRVST